jgi:hypothetical protein
LLVLSIKGTTDILLACSSKTIDSLYIYGTDIKTMHSVSPTSSVSYGRSLIKQSMNESMREQLAA